MTVFIWSCPVSQQLERDDDRFVVLTVVGAHGKQFGAVNLSVSGSTTVSVREMTRSMAERVVTQRFGR